LRGSLLEEGGGQALAFVVGEERGGVTNPVYVPFKGTAFFLAQRTLAALAC
jgi:hypothetical protein